MVVDLIFLRCGMQLKPFLLDMWLDAHEHDIEFNLAAYKNKHVSECFVQKLCA